MLREFESPGFVRVLMYVMFMLLAAAAAWTRLGDSGVLINHLTHWFRT